MKKLKESFCSKCGGKYIWVKGKNFGIKTCKNCGHKLGKINPLQTKET